MKRKRLLIGMVLSLAVCLCLALFCACGETPNAGNPNDTGSGDPSAQYEIYEKYVAYASAAGDDVLSYEEWLDSIRGQDGVDGKDGSDGQDGADGKSAYDIWLENGHSGTVSDFLDWLKGEKGEDGQDGADGKDGKDGKDGQNGTNGQDGKSAYDIWKENGHSGTEAEFLEWLKGEKGENGQNGADGKDGKDGADGKDGKDGADGKDGKDGQNGTNGQDGKSAYDIWKENGHSGTEAEFLEWLKGEKGENGQNGADGKDGKDGLSAFDIFKKYYPFYDGSEEEWLADLVNGNLTVYKVTFKSEVAEDIVRRVFKGHDLTDIPEVPEKEGQASAKWDRDDFTNITSDIEVHAVYTMKKFTVTFHNEYTEEEDETRTVEYGQAVEDVPTVKEKVGNVGVWDVTDFSNITDNMTVNAVYETIGLAYTLINDQQEYRVSAGTMNVETEELFIPAVHDEKPVTVIAENAFKVSYPDRYQFKLAHLPESITEIRASAFCNCESLQSINIPSKVTVISDETFFACSALSSVKMPNVTEISYRAFAGCTNLANVEIPQVMKIGPSAFATTGLGNGCASLTSIEMPNVTSIGNYAFSGSALEHLEIPSGVTHIGSYSPFQNCTSLKYVILPSGMTYIAYDVFKGCSVFEAIYFKGNAKEWAALDKSDAGGVFNDAKVYYYADPMPEENESDYWHYDVDDKTPVVWKKED